MNTLPAFDWTNLITFALQIVLLAVAGAIVLAVVIHEIRRQTILTKAALRLIPDELEQKYHTVALKAVAYAEWIYSGIRGAGPEKLQAAIRFVKDYLKANNIQVPDTAFLEELIEYVLSQQEPGKVRRIPTATEAQRRAAIRDKVAK